MIFFFQIIPNELHDPGGSEKYMQANFKAFGTMENCSRHGPLIKATGQEANGGNLGMSFLSYLK